MDPVAFERNLRRRIFGVIAAAAPLAAACGATGSDEPDCQSCFCGKPLPPSTTYDVVYTPCQAATDASDDVHPADASSDATITDASSDAGDDVADAAIEHEVPACQTCGEACRGRESVGATTVCLGETVDGGVHIAHCLMSYLCGRRLEGLASTSFDSASVGDVLAHAAWLEAASIHAFRRLARELRAHGAPRELIDAARSCARDEARHARTMARLARCRGAEVPRVDVDDPGIRDLEAIARENAIEGCVNETFGALLAIWQSEHAHDPDVRAAMREIAPDELRHAALAWAVAAWADTRLTSKARDRVRHARDEAVDDVLRNAHIDPGKDVAFVIGMPRAAHAARLAVGMRAAVWT